MTLKAAECGPMLEFVLWLLHKHGGVGTFGAAFIEAGESLKLLVKGLGSKAMVPTADEMKNLRSILQTHIRSCRLAGINLVPKHHLLIHMLDRTQLTKRIPWVVG